MNEQKYKLTDMELHFIKNAEEAGCDPVYVLGFLDEATDIMNKWAEYVDEAEKQSGDPLYRYKLAEDLSRLVKPGAYNNPLVLDTFNYLQSYNHMGKQASFGTTAGGGGIGALIGLLLGQGLFNSPMLGLLLGGLGGGALGHFYGDNIMDKLKGWMGQGGQPGAQPAPNDQPTTDPGQALSAEQEGLPENDIPQETMPSPEEAPGQLDPSSLGAPAEGEMLGDEQPLPPEVASNPSLFGVQLNKAPEPGRSLEEAGLLGKGREMLNRSIYNAGNAGKAVGGTVAAGIGGAADGAANMYNNVSSPLQNAGSWLGRKVFGTGPTPPPPRVRPGQSITPPGVSSGSTQPMQMPGGQPSAPNMPGMQMPRSVGTGRPQTPMQFPAVQPPQANNMLKNSSAILDYWLDKQANSLSPLLPPGTPVMTNQHAVTMPSSTTFKPLGTPQAPMIGSAMPAPKPMAPKMPTMPKPTNPLAL